MNQIQFSEGISIFTVSFFLHSSPLFCFSFSVTYICFVAHSILFVQTAHSSTVQLILFSTVCALNVFFPLVCECVKFYDHCTNACCTHLCDVGILSALHFRSHMIWDVYGLIVSQLVFWLTLKYILFANWITEFTMIS